MNVCHFGDSRDIMRRLIAEGTKVQMCVTSPPYWALRDYGHPGQLGLEHLHDCLGWATDDPCGECHVCHMVSVFRLVREMLTDEGTCWVNYGDSYASAGGAGCQGKHGARADRTHTQKVLNKKTAIGSLKPKDLVMMPARIALALQADGWYLRQDIIWHKPNPMPESVTDRCTKSHEYIFLLSKSRRYYFDARAIAQPISESSKKRLAQPNLPNQHGIDRVPGKTNGNMKAVGPRFGGNEYTGCDGFANRRSVWTVPTVPYKGAHFATFPPALIEPCILAGSRPGDVVLDPFFGSGTTGQVAQALGRQWIGCEINRGYEQLQNARVAQMGMIL